MKSTLLGLGQVREHHLDHNGHMNMVVYMDIVDKYCDLLVTNLKMAQNFQTDLLYFVREANFTFLSELMLDDEWDIELTKLESNSFYIHLAFTLRARSKVKFRAKLQLVCVDSKTRKLSHLVPTAEIDMSMIEVHEYKH